VIPTPEIAWVAGLLEGEGAFLMSGRSITIVMPSTDRDVIERIALLLGARVYGPLKRGLLQQGYKPMYRAQVKGPAAAGWIPRPLADAILAYRSAGYCQTDIVALLGVSKSTVYRHTVGRVRRMRITTRRLSTPAAAPPRTPAPAAKAR
jgi:hypothetical protein